MSCDLEDAGRCEGACQTRWMYAIATFLVVALLSLLFTRLATGALIATGMPPGAAGFQARSAFTGAGFTTTEAENVVNHPVRRRVISTTMFVGNLGVPTLVVTVTLGFVVPGPGETSTRAIVLTAGIAVLVALAFTRPVTDFFVALGRRGTQPLLRRSLTGRVVPLLRLSDEHQVVALPLSDDVPLRSIRGLQQALPDVLVLGVRPGGARGRFISGPPSDVDLHAGDDIVILARSESLDEILDGLGEPPTGAGPVAL
jgi:hypothetical protein